MITEFLRSSELRRRTPAVFFSILLDPSTVRRLCVQAFSRLLKFHADTVSSRQRINFTGHGDIGDSLTGVVFE